MSGMESAASKPKVIKKSHLQKYLQAPHYDKHAIGKKPAVGVVNGLAWTCVGGELLTIEALKLPGKGELVYTGSLGEVMRGVDQSCLFSGSFSREKVSVQT